MEAIDRVMDHISLMHEAKDEMSMEEAERYMDANKKHNDNNLQANLSMDYMMGMSKEWLSKSRKKTQKAFLSNFTKHDHMRFHRQLEKSFGEMKTDWAWLTISWHFTLSKGLFFQIYLHYSLITPLIQTQGVLGFWGFGVVAVVVVVA